MNPKYQWILDGEIAVQVCGKNRDRFLVVKENDEQAVILRELPQEWAVVPGFSSDRHILLNDDVVVMSDSERPQILGIMRIASEECPFKNDWCYLAAGEIVVSEDPSAARPGPGQAEDNYVHQMACGHQYDAPELLPVGRHVNCSAHGDTYIIQN